MRRERYGDWGHAFGTLPTGLDTQAIVDRARIGWSWWCIDIRKNGQVPIRAGEIAWRYGLDPKRKVGLRRLCARGRHPGQLHCKLCYIEW